jgi:Transglycosylase SLT domain
MDYSRLRRSTNVEDNRASGGLEAMWNEIRPNIPTWDEWQKMAEHPATPRSELKKKPILRTTPVNPGSMEDQAGARTLKDIQDLPADEEVTLKGNREDRGNKGDRLDRPSFQFADGDAAGRPKQPSQPTVDETTLGAATRSTGGATMPAGTVDAITRAANEAGEDPAFALAVAERESNGNPNAHSSRSIYGIYQMTGNLRQQYGSGNSSDPYEQAQGWMRFIGDTRQDMTNRLGRAPTNEELYLAHHFGPDRAAGMLTGRIPNSMATSDVFSPYEMSINPHFGRAGTVGNLTSGITGDIAAREARYGGATGHEAPDFASFGQSPAGQGIDFAQFGQPVDLKVNNQPAPAPAESRPGTEIDLSQYGLTPGATPGI